MSEVIEGVPSTEDRFKLLLKEEALILDAQMMIQKALNERGLKQKDLAAMLGVRPSYVSQMLGLSGRNLTLRTIAKVMHALGTSAGFSARGADPAFAAEVASAEGIQDAASPDDTILDDSDTCDAADDERSARAKGDAMARISSLMAVGSQAWGNVVALPPRERRRRRGRSDAEAFSEYDAPYLEAA